MQIFTMRKLKLATEPTKKSPFWAARWRLGIVYTFVVKDW
jgi:hypothetical protein